MIVDDYEFETVPPRRRGLPRRQRDRRADRDRGLDRRLLAEDPRLKIGPGARGRARAGAPADGALQPGACWSAAEAVPSRGVRHRRPRAAAARRSRRGGPPSADARRRGSAACARSARAPWPGSGGAPQARCRCRDRTAARYRRDGPCPGSRAVREAITGTPQVIASRATIENVSQTTEGITTASTSFSRQRHQPLLIGAVHPQLATLDASASSRSSSRIRALDGPEQGAPHIRQPRLAQSLDQDVGALVGTTAPSSASSSRRAPALAPWSRRAGSGELVTPFGITSRLDRPAGARSNSRRRRPTGAITRRPAPARSRSERARAPASERFLFCRRSSAAHMPGRVPGPRTASPSVRSRWARSHAT